MNDFDVTLKYDSKDDKISFNTSRPLTNADVVLLLSNLMGLLNEEDRRMATTIALRTVDNAEAEIAKLPIRLIQ